MSGLESLRADRAKERERQAAKQKKLEDTFKDLLQHYYYRSDHIAVPWKKALRRVKHRSAFRDLDRKDKSKEGEKSRAEVLFDEHIVMLREQMGATEEDIRKAEAEAAKEGDSSDDGDSDDDHKSRKKRSKSEKKSSKKSHRRHKSDKKRSRRSSSRSRS